MLDLGIETKLAVLTDANAARATANRTGMGKVRHIEAKHLGIQEKVATNVIDLRKISGTENTADAFTKYVGRNLIAWYMKQVGQEFTEGRHPLMPDVRKSTDRSTPGLDAVEEEFAEENPEISE